MNETAKGRQYGRAQNTIHLMPIFLAILFAADLIPIVVALRANRGTSLLHAILWAIIAWLSWGVAYFVSEPVQPGVDPFRYCALCLTGCAGIAVLGARRPHVFAWNFVVLGLFAVMVLPLIETAVIGTHSMDGLRIVFMAGTIAVGAINYLPTRMGLAAFALMIACTGEMTILFAPHWLDGIEPILFGLLFTSVPWLAWISLSRNDAKRSAFDRQWLHFRDRWGLVWSQRVREQFNQSAHHAGWPIKLTWFGLMLEESEAGLTPADHEKIAATLRATLQRFIKSFHQAGDR